MYALVKKIFFLKMAFFFSANLFAAEEKNYLYLEVEGRYSKEWTKITLEKKNWICSTEIMPKKIMHFNPLQQISSEFLRGVEKKKNICPGSTVKVLEQRSGRKQFLSMCMGDPTVDDFVAKINEICR